MKSRVRDPIAIQVGVRLKIARDASGMTQGDLARALGIGQMRLSNWELGKHWLPPKTAIRIFELLRIDSNWLFLGDPHRLPHEIFPYVVATWNEWLERHPPPPPPPIKPKKPRKPRKPGKRAGNARRKPDVPYRPQ